GRSPTGQRRGGGETGGGTRARRRSPPIERRAPRWPALTPIPSGTRPRSRTPRPAPPGAPPERCRRRVLLHQRGPGAPDGDVDLHGQVLAGRVDRPDRAQGRGYAGRRPPPPSRVVVLSRCV